MDLFTTLLAVGLLVLIVILNNNNNTFQENNSINNKKTKKSKRSPNGRDDTFKLYKENKSLKDIIKISGKTSQTIEGHILHIFEHYENIEIDPEYFGLTEEYEEEIKDVVKKIGSEYLKPIKDAVNNKITYGQIKLCLLIIKIESEE